MQKKVELTDNLHDRVRCLLMTIEGAMLLLPNAAISEVAVINTIKPVSEQAPAWLAGMMNWRGLFVPLVVWEQYLQPVSPKPDTFKRIAVLNTLTGSKKLPFIGIGLQTIPSLISVDINKVDVSNKAVDAEQGNMIKLETNEVLVPNIYQLEKRIKTLLGI